MIHVCHILHAPMIVTKGSALQWTHLAVNIMCAGLAALLLQKVGHAQR